MPGCGVGRHFPCRGTWTMSWWKQIQASRAKQRRREKPMFPKARLYVEQLEKRWLMTAGLNEYALSANSSPQGIVAGPDGNLWFAESTGQKIGKITTSGTITEYTTPTRPS